MQSQPTQKISQIPPPTPSPSENLIYHFGCLRNNKKEVSLPEKLSTFTAQSRLWKAPHPRIQGGAVTYSALSIAISKDTTEYPWIHRQKPSGVACALLVDPDGSFQSLLSSLEKAGSWFDPRCLKAVLCPGRRWNIPVPTAPAGTPRSCPSLWPCHTEECPPGMSHFPGHPCSLWMECGSAMTACRTIPEILDQYSRGLGTAHKKFTGLATLPFQNTERELKWRFSLSSPSTAPAQHFPSFLAGRTNTFGIYSEFQPLLNPTAGFGQYQLHSQSWFKNKQEVIG